MGMGPQELSYSPVSCHLHIMNRVGEGGDMQLRKLKKKMRQTQDKDYKAGRRRKPPSLRKEIDLEGIELLGESNYSDQYSMVFGTYIPY